MAEDVTSQLPKPPKSIYLGDGAYATHLGHEVLITANHHDPILASDRVHIDTVGIEILITWLKLHQGIK